MRFCWTDLMAQEPMEVVRTFYKSANQLKDRGDWQAALADYDRASEAYPDYPPRAM